MAKYEQYTKKDGTKAWMFQAYLGLNPTTGKEVRTTRRGFETKKEATLTLSRLQLEIEQNGFKKSKTYTYNDLYLLWLELYKNTVKESTFVKTKCIFNKHILPHFGEKQIDKIDIPYCQKGINLWLTKIKKYKVIMNYASKVFEYGITLGIINDNPTKKITMPVRKENVTEEKEKNFYTKEELLEFFTCLEKEGNKKVITFFRLLAFTGARKGEILALTWNDIDLKKNTLKINKSLSRGENARLIIQTPKTKSSVRTISIDPKTSSILKLWKNTQKEDYFRLGINTTVPNQLIFSNIENSFLQPSKSRKWLLHIFDKYGLKEITTHGFRHTHCSLLFESGASIQEVQDRLGHSDVQTTMNIYTHVTEQAKEQTADKFAKHVNF